MLKSIAGFDPELEPSVGAPVGFGVVGLGYWGPNLIRVLANNEDVELRWICDLDRERLTKYRRRYPSARATTQLMGVLGDPRVDAVVIATPVHTHYDLAREAL